MKIYLSGKITGLEFTEVTRNFVNAKTLVTCCLPVREVINPLAIKPLFGIENWYCIMAADLWELMFCDAIFMQTNWKDSRGARIEHAFAKALFMKIYYE